MVKDRASYRSELADDPKIARVTDDDVLISNHKQMVTTALDCRYHLFLRGIVPNTVD